MTPATLRYRPAALALCLIALSATGGCAHFRNAEERAERGRMAQTAAAEPSPALALPEPAPAPAPAAPPAAPMPAPVSPPPAVAPPAPPPQAAEAAPPPAAEPGSPIVNEPPPPPPAAATPIASPAAPASDAAIIVFANTPGASCVNCDTLKISVAPSGQVLIERGLWSGENRSWRYKRSTAHVDPARAAAFAATLRGDRPMGTRLRGDSTLCLGAGTENDGLVIEWIEAGRHDTLTYAFGCPAGRHSPSAERLRHAPDLLDLRELAWPGADGQPLR